LGKNFIIKKNSMLQRDGNCESLWQDDFPDYNSSNQPSADAVYDVAIVGGGITGITTALLLQKAGKKCIVFESHNLCFGTTGGTTAHLNTILDTPYATIIKNFGKEKAKLVAKATREAVDLVKKHVEEYDIDCGFEEQAAFLFSQTDKQTEELDDIYEACNEVGIDVEYVMSLPVKIESQKIMQINGQAKFHPTRYVYALADAFEDLGGVIVQHCRVNDVKNNEIIDIETNCGDYKATNLIYATHTPPGINLLHLRSAPWRSYAMAFTVKNKKYPDGLVYDMHDPYHYIRSQQVGNKKYLIVGGEDHKTGEIANTESCLLHLQSYVQRYFDVDEVLFKWSSQYFEPSDGIAYIGHLPGHEGKIFTASGYGGNGMTYSHIAALTLKSMILNEVNSYIDVFDPNRVKPVAGFKSFLGHNADVVKKFIGKWFGKEKLEEFADLAPGEGRVVKYDGETVALYKDENGELHAVNPTCTHMKCSVAWNSAEKTWDCPCHGSRFSSDGEVLTGPAEVNLEYIEVRTLIEHD
jgi:glycine/D-amino acid oxidase-like deaminating enzyme/nitrite reductase/ring-hydroxylating ferredoxin subunit